MIEKSHLAEKVPLAERRQVMPFVALERQ